MIVNDHLASYTRLVPYLKPSMLMLGSQRNTSSFRFPCEYHTLDMDGRSDIHADLGSDTFATEVGSALYETVFDLGTLEHVWDTHQAYVNAASLVNLGGYFLGQAPVAGWENHAVHITDWRFILMFFKFNGFTIAEWWLTTANGAPMDTVQRNGGKSALLWYAARRIERVKEWKKPSQVYTNGVKP